MLNAHDLIMQILLYAVQLAVVFLIGSAANLIIAKVGQTKFAKYVNYANMAVQAAEQIFGPGVGSNKKNYVVDWLVKKIGKKLSADEIDKLIEAAVFEMNLIIKNKTDQPPAKIPDNILNVDPKPNSTNESSISAAGSSPPMKAPDSPVQESTALTT